MNIVEQQPVAVVTNALNQLVLDLIDVVPRLIIALIVWYLGIYFLSFTTKVVNKFNIKRTNLDDKAVSTLSAVIGGVGKFILVLIILDYLGIGRTIVNAVATGFTYAVAIALGLAFGRALEPEAINVVSEVKKFLKTK